MNIVESWKFMFKDEGASSGAELRFAKMRVTLMWSLISIQGLDWTTSWQNATAIHRCTHSQWNILKENET